MYAERHVVTVTSATGTGTGYTPVITGRIWTIRYIKPGAASYSDGVDFTITLEGTGETVWAQDNVNASVTVAPRQATKDIAGVASCYAAAGEPVEDYIIAVNDRVKIAVAAAGTATTGEFHVVVG